MEVGQEESALIDNNINARVINIRQVAGVIDQEELPRLRRIIYRGTKGKSYMYVQSIPNDDNEDENTKTRAVYIIVYWSGNHIRDKL